MSAHPIMMSENLKWAAAFSVMVAGEDCSESNQKRENFAGA
jgi:hypothetical protein